MTNTLNNLVGSFEAWLEKKYPDICMVCWGEGKLLFSGQYIKNAPIECPACKGTGKKQQENPELLEGGER